MASPPGEEAFEKLAALAEEYPRVWKTFGPVDNEVVEAVEARLELRLPRSYRLFLLRHGFAIMWGCCINGIQRDSTVNNPVSSLLRDTERGRVRGDIPRDCLYIEDRDESDILLDISQMKDGEAPIIEVPIGTSPQDVDRTPISPSFAEYYLAQLTEMIEYLKEIGKL